MSVPHQVMTCFGPGCYCLIDEKQFHCHQTNWNEIFAIPGTTDFSLLGNDSNKSIHTCKILLTVLGPKFETLLGASEIRLDYPFSVVEAINDLALTGRPKIDESNVELLLKAAKEFNLIGFKKFASIFLLSNLNAKNVVRIYQLAMEFLCSHDIQRIEKYILSNITDLAEHPEFLHNCTAEWMLQWLKNDELNAPEESIFLILQSWAQISENNAKSFGNLVKQIRFNLLKPEFFNVVLKPCPLLRDKFFLQEAQKSVRSVTTTVHHQLRFRPKNLRLPFELVFSVGGFGSQSLPTLEVFDVRANRWFQLQNHIPSLSYHGMVTHNYELMTFGGFGDDGFGAGPNFISTAFRFNLLEKTWRKTSFAETKRCYVCVVKLGDDIYCIGGFNGNIRLNSVEKYSLDADAWSHVQPMKVHRSDASAVTYGNLIIVVGGYNGEEILSSTEIYDPVRDEWVFGPRLNVPRSGLKVISLILANF
jgi:kelch-like protein 10